MDHQDLVDKIDNLLPQTQCQKCGYQGCRPYAEAMANQQAAINQCPPGGQSGVQALAELLGLAEIPLNQTLVTSNYGLVAKIIEQDCIGCTKCLPPCPVDAIVGTSKQMHTVLSSLCTGCELCIAPCPVDCIVMEKTAVGKVGQHYWNKAQAEQAKNRYINKRTRVERLNEERKQRLKQQKQALKKLI